MVARVNREIPFGVQKILTFYDIWLRNRHLPKSFLFIRYEDLHNDPHGTFGKVMHFLGETNIDEYLLKQSVEYCSFENLKELEVQDKFKNRILRPMNIEDQDSYKIRKGKVGGYSEYLSNEGQAFIDEAIEDYNFDLKNFTKSNKALQRT